MAESTTERLVRLEAKIDQLLDERGHGDRWCTLCRVYHPRVMLQQNKRGHLRAVK